MYDEMVKDLRENHDKYFARDMVAANAIEELQAQLMYSNDAAKAIADKVPKWIPVTERLPMRGEKAICFGKNGYMIGTYGEFGWMFPCYFGNVTHWMPLPKQPEDGAE